MKRYFIATIKIPNLTSYVNEINSIKKGIDEIIKETGNINSAVKPKTLV